MLRLVTGEVKTCSPPPTLTGTDRCRSGHGWQNFDGLHVRTKKEHPAGCSKSTFSLSLVRKTIPETAFIRSSILFHFTFHILERESRTLLPRAGSVGLHPL